MIPPATARTPAGAAPAANANVIAADSSTVRVSAIAARPSLPDRSGFRPADLEPGAGGACLRSALSPDDRGIPRAPPGHTVARAMRPSRLNVLIVTAQFPYPPRSGFAMRVYHLARRLAERHDVTLLGCARPHERGGVEALGEEMRVEAVERAAPSASAKRAAQAASLPSPRPYACRKVHSRALQQRIDELCAAERFDVVQLESSLLCTFGFPRGVPLVIDEHNIEYEVFARMHTGERSHARRAFNRLEPAASGASSSAGGAARPAASSRPSATGAPCARTLPARRSRSCRTASTWTPSARPACRPSRAASSSTASSTTARTSTPPTTWSTRSGRASSVTPPTRA